VKPIVVATDFSEDARNAALRAGLLVVGARGQHPLRDFALGTTAERLVRMSTAPVLVVKRAPKSAYRRVLAPVDFSADAAGALALAARLAPEAALSVLHAFEVPFESALRLADAPPAEIERNRREARDAAREAMEKMLRPLGLGSRATRLLEHGYAPARIAEAEKRSGADLVAIGKHGRGVLEELLIGSVTLHALAGSQCDVLVVPAPRAGRARRSGAGRSSRPPAGASARRPRRR